MSTKDEIRAALEEAVCPDLLHTISDGHDVCEATMQRAIEAVEALLPAETETVEWGVKYEGAPDPERVYPRASEMSARDDADASHDVSAWHRTVTTYATEHTPWEEA